MYDPLTDPLRLPVQQLTAHCLAERPLYFPPREGSTPGTTFNGAFGSEIWAVGCQRRQQGLPACNQTQDHCQQPAACPVHWLYKPYSTAHRRAFSRPVLLHAPGLDSANPITSFTLKITLWGRHAIRHRTVVEQTIRAMGQAGLGSEGSRTRFTVAEMTAELPMALGDKAAALIANNVWRRVLLAFETPFLYRATVEGHDGQKEKLFLAGGALPLSAMLGNRAYELAAWDMEERGLDLDSQARHDLARQTRQHVEALAEALIVTDHSLVPVNHGSRQAKSNGRFFPIQGFVGQAQIEGDINPVLPWLLALAVGGGGQKRAMGFGVVRLWLQVGDV